MPLANHRMKPPDLPAYMYLEVVIPCASSPMPLLDREHAAADVAAAGRPLARASRRGQLLKLAHEAGNLPHINSPSP